jgi:hypothetical protein
VSAALIVLRPPVMDRQPGMPATEIHVLGSAGVFADAINGASLVADLGPLTTPDRVQRVVIDAVAAAYQARKAGGSGVIGAENAPAAPEWSAYFSYGSPQRSDLQRLRAAAASGSADVPNFGTIGDAIADRYAPGVLSTPGGADAIRSSSANLPNNLGAAVPSSYSWTRDASTAGNGTRVGLTDWLVRLYYDQLGAGDPRARPRRATRLADDPG